MEQEEEKTEFARYFLQIAYDGTNYHGWQRQPNAHSVQEEIEKALCKILRLRKVVTLGCGRTDTGVHASDFYLHFVPEIHELNEGETLFRLQQVLPKDIAAYRLFKVNNRAHASFDANERSYEYRIAKKKDPFQRNYTYFYGKELNVEAMNNAARLMLGSHDFACFCKSGGGQMTTMCDVREARWEEKDSLLIFHITADRFLRNMVRAVVGTLLQVGRGEMSLEEFQEVLNSKSRNAAGESVRPNGLFLTRVIYPESTFRTN